MATLRRSLRARNCPVGSEPCCQTSPRVQRGGDRCGLADETCACSRVPGLYQRWRLMPCHVSAKSVTSLGSPKIRRHDARMGTRPAVSERRSFSKCRRSDANSAVGRTASVGGTDLIHPGGQTGRQFAEEMRQCTESQGKASGRSREGPSLFCRGRRHTASGAARGTVMRRILVVDDDMRTGRAVSIWLAPGLVATRSPPKRSRRATLLAVIDECLSEAEQRGNYRRTPSHRKNPDRPATIATEESLVESKYLFPGLR